MRATHARIYHPATGFQIDRLRLPPPLSRSRCSSYLREISPTARARRPSRPLSNVYTRCRRDVMTIIERRLAGNQKLPWNPLHIEPPFLSRRVCASLPRRCFLTGLYARVSHAQYVYAYKGDSRVYLARICIPATRRCPPREGPPPRDGPERAPNAFENTSALWHAARSSSRCGVMRS